LINVTSLYPIQAFLAPAQSQIIAQINSVNNSGVPSIVFPKIYTRLSSAGTAPDGTGAAMYQVDALIAQSGTYSYSSTQLAQQGAQQAASYTGNEYYIELDPIPTTYYSILVWASNL
jgi:hypothetical protein